MLNIVLLIVVVGGTILAYPCAFKRGVFREVIYLAHALSKRCVQRGVFKEVCSERCIQRGVLSLNSPPNLLLQGNTSQKNSSP